MTGLNLDGGDSSLSDGLAHFTCPSLPHFIALLCRPSPTSLPEGTALVVVDALSALLNQAFPKSVDHKPLAKGNGGGAFHSLPNLPQNPNPCRPECIGKTSACSSVYLGGSAEASRDTQHRSGCSHTMRNPFPGRARRYADIRR